MAQSIIGSGNEGGLLVSAGVSCYAPLGSGALPSAANTNESNVQIPWRSPGTFSNLTAKVTAAPDADSNVNYRDNGSAGNQLVLFPANTTGTFVDVVHNDTPSPGDLINLQINNFGVVNSMIIRGMVYAVFSPTTTTNTVNKFQTYSGSAVSTSVSSSYYQALGGSLSSTTNSTTEANVQFTVKTPGTFKNLFIQCTTNLAASASLYKLRKNGADGNVVASVTGLSTGIFEDVIHNDSVISGDLVNTVIVTPAAGNVQFINGGIDFVTINSTSHFILGNGSGASPGTAPRFCGLEGYTNISSGAGSSSLVSVVTGSKFISSNLECYMIANSSGSTANLKVFKNDLAGNEILNYGAAVTGYLEDAIHNDSFLPTDKFSFQATAVTSGTITPGNFGILASYPVVNSGAATFSASASLAAVGRKAGVGAATLSASAALSAVGARKWFGAATFMPKMTASFSSIATKLSVGTLSASASLAVTGRAQKNRAVIFSPSASLACVGVGMHRSVGIISPSASFSVVGKSLFKGTASLIGAVSFSAPSITTKKTTGTFLASASLVARGASVSKSHASFSSTVSASFAGKTVRLSTAMFSASASLMITRRMLFGGAGTFLASTSLIVAGKNGSRSVATISARSIFSATGIGGTQGAAVITSRVSFSVIGVRALAPPPPNRILKAYFPW